jgi:hypothetical protein
MDEAQRKMTEAPTMVDADFRDLVWAAMRGGAAPPAQPLDVLGQLRELGQPASVQQCLHELFPDRQPSEVAYGIARGVTDGDIVELPAREDGAILYVADRRYRRRLDSHLLALLRPEQAHR